MMMMLLLLHDVSCREVREAGVVFLTHPSCQGNNGGRTHHKNTVAVVVVVVRVAVAVAVVSSVRSPHPQ